MKYLILIYSSPQTWNALTSEQRERMVEEHSELYNELVASGEWVDGNILAAPENGRSIRPGGLVTDGPFIEAKEHMAGYDLVDCDSLERAMEIARRIPDAAICGVEVRPVG